MNFVKFYSKNKNYFYILTGLLIAIFINLGCASFAEKYKAFLNNQGGNTKQSGQANKTSSLSSKSNKNLLYSQNSDAGFKVPRNYSRVTKETLEREAEINENLGSLWVNEGQSAYLFSQNNLRRNGSFLNIKLDGHPLQQITKKVSIIKNLIDKYELQMQKYKKNTNKQNPAVKNLSQNSQNEKKENTTKNENAKQVKEDKKNKIFEVEVVPAKIVEKLANGNYRIKGSQQFLIDKHEFKLLIMGILKSSDINEEKINASKLLDAKFDILSMRNKVRAW